MKRVGAAAIAALAVTLLFMGPVAANSDAAPRTPPTHPRPPSPPAIPSDPPSSDPPSAPDTPPAAPSHPADPSHPVAPSHPADPSHPVPPSHPADPSQGSAVSDAAKGLGQTVSAIAKGSAGQPDTSAIQAAVGAHKQAVQDAAHASGGGAGTTSTTVTTGAPDGGGGNSAIARGHGEDVAALATSADGARGVAVSAFARTFGAFVREAALTLGDGGQHVSSLDDPDIALDSGVVPDDEDSSGSVPLVDPAFTQLSP